MSGARWLDDDEQRLWRAYLQANVSLTAAMERQLGQHGLSQADFAVLVPLSESEDGVLRPRDLGHAAGWDRSRLSHQIRRMEQRGLVERRSCETDARGTLVALTPAGRRAVEAVAPGHVDVVREQFVDLLTPRERSALTRVFERVRDAAGPSTAACDDEG